MSVTPATSSVHDPADDLTGLIDLADQALYFSKENGRNRTTRFDQMASTR